MKKSALIAALLCAVSSGVYAASDVTLYGVVDGAVSVSKAKGKAARVGFDNGIWAGSRFGIKGNEDLGSGYNLGFILEQGFKTFSGDAMNSSKAFARQSTLSVSTPFGTFAAGVQAVCLPTAHPTIFCTVPLFGLPTTAPAISTARSFCPTVWTMSCCTTHRT